VKTALKGKRVHDAEDVMKNMAAEMNTVPLEAFADCFRKHFNVSKNVFKWAKISLNKNNVIVVM
jgi:predicted RNA-binding protein (virulence factor B family)